MTFWHVIGIIALLVSVGAAINGALKSKGDVLNILSFLLIPAFAIAAIVALTMPQEPGWSANEITMAIIVGVLGLAMAYTNQKVTERNIKRLRSFKK